ncbi:MAG: zinc ribbon domain-containing protein [Clostridiales bacterium]|jgi:RNA polymerase subunit RPABC4/transcription elongation factor Spt4|nr:zinc ribbon domain-containing protein [Clostridiales bacterium]
MDDIKSTITDLAGNVAKTSSRFLKSTKLSMALSSEEQKLKNLYIEIGKKVHEIYTYGGSLGGVFDECYARLRELDTRIKDIKREIAESRGLTACPKCGARVDRDSDFCPKCGSQLSGAAPAPTRSMVSPTYQTEPAPNAPLPAESGKACPVCGRRNGLGERFCVACGRAL